MRLPLRLVVLALVVVASAGCVTVRAEIHIDHQGMAEGFAEAVVDRRAAEGQGHDVDQVVGDIDLGDYLSTVGVEPDNRVELVIDRDDQTVITVRFAEAPADGIALLGGDPLISIAPDGSMSLEGEVDPAALGGGSRAELAVEFPFEVVETNGELDGSTVRWRMSGDDAPQRLSARTNDVPYESSPASAAWVAAGAVMTTVVVAAGGLAVWMWSRRSERPRAGR